ncbi:MAG: SxtJ family membrane protein [Limisphaerales bacterium]
MLLIGSGIAFWRELVSLEAIYWIAGFAIGIALLAFFRPATFRPFYRGAMKASFAVGQVMGKVILSLFFLFVLTPMGLALRIMGKDLLETRLDRDRASYWKKARKRGRMDQQF